MTRSKDKDDEEGDAPKVEEIDEEDEKKQKNASSARSDAQRITTGSSGFFFSAPSIVR